MTRDTRTALILIDRPPVWPGSPLDELRAWRRAVVAMYTRYPNTTPFAKGQIDRELATVDAWIAARLPAPGAQ